MTHRPGRVAEPSGTTQREYKLHSLFCLMARAYRLSSRLAGRARDVCFEPAAVRRAPAQRGGRQLHIAALIAALLWFCVPGRVVAEVMVVYTVQDVADTTPGEDRWQYDYQVSGHDFLAGESLVVYFDFGAFEDITPLTSPGPGWGLDPVDPDKFLGPGLLVATAPAAGGASPLAFAVQFNWLQPGQPRDQAFDLFGPEPDYTVLASGRTAPIPEPSTVLLLAIGVVLLPIAFRKRAPSRLSRALRAAENG
jgi:PEP-CTERM motif